jgi:hypothetical protein
MRMRLSTRRFGIRSHPITLIAVVAAVGLLSAAPASALRAAPGVHAAAAAGQSVKPNKTGELDCNGYSPIQKSVRRTMLCSDLHGGIKTGGRFYDNGWYIGHDEPDLRFLSTATGSGSNATWTERLGLDPAAAPTVTSPGHDVTHYAELTPAPWFSMALCDPQSYPENPCTPNSDANAPAPSCIGVTPSCLQANAGGGSAFMELQFYPPGEAPFADSISCDNTHWCAALTIDSLEATLNFATINPNCTEPVNFGFIQTDGVPTGPPSPQLSDLATFTPNARTLLMNPGDKITVHMFDAPLSGGGHAFEAVVRDATTGQTGFMQASAANGFMNTDVSTCDGTPFNFRPEYSTASADNIVPWAALAVNISTEFEIGHFEPCSTVTSPATNFLSSTVTDTYWKHCVGAYENTTAPDGGKSPETSDAPCYPQGDTHNGLAPPNIVTGCEQFYTQNGDLDFDGTPYWADWPDSTKPDTFPSTFLESAPTTVGGANYSQFQFQTDVALSESTCAGPAGPGCAVPPPNAPGAFYPYWTSSSACTWEFGNMTNGNAFGKDGQYGTDQFATLGYQEFASGLFPNTCG